MLFQTTLTAEYLYKDDVVNNPKFTKEIEERGADLYEKTGISLKLVMIRDLPHGVSILEYQDKILQELTGPSVLLIFAELNSQIDISVNDTSLYKYFKREQVLSPVASKAQAYAMAIIFARSFDDFKELSADSGGTILPLLGAKAKAGEVTGKYAASMFNGYIDIAGQIAESKGVKLKYGNGQTGTFLLFIVKIIFYGILLLALAMYIRKKLYERRNK
ncbi:MAG: 3-dehydroquinate dehydratase [Sulfurimonas sp.]|nr:3-dehydroquinate dehydratase [Sulfurimonas sp.]